MELVVISILIVLLGCVVIGAVGVTAAIGALVYGKFYHDNAEVTGARKWTFFRYLRGWNILRAYVSFEVRDAASNKSIRIPLCSHVRGESDKSIIFACHPHGLIPLAPLLTFGVLSEAHFPRHNKSVLPRLHVHRLLFSVPFLRDFCLWLGCMDISENVLRERLSTTPKAIVALVPAGSRGILGDMNAETRHRGFLRLAYEYKAQVVPCWSPTEKRIFKMWDLFPSLRRWAVSVTGYPFPTPFLGPLPFKKLIMYIGRTVCPQEYDTLEAFQEAYHEELEQLMRRYNENGLVC